LKLGSNRTELFTGPACSRASNL